MTTLNLNTIMTTRLLSRPHLTALAAVSLLAGAFLYAADQPPQTGDLIKALNSSATRKEKADACRELSLKGGKEAVAPLAVLLADPELSHMARYGLEPIADASVDQALRDALPKVSGRLQAGVISSLGVRRDAKAVPAIAGLLGSTEADVRQAAARALGSIATPEAVAAIQKARPSAAATDQLAFSEGLLKAAEALDRQSRRKEALAIYDSLREVDALPAQVRTAAWRGAIVGRGTDASKLLQEALKHDDRAVFSAGVRASMELDRPPALAPLLKTFPADKQIMILQVLAKRHDRSAVPEIISCARQGEPEVRMAAVRALGELGDASAVPSLLELFTAPETQLAGAAREAFAALPAAAVEPKIREMLRSPEPPRQMTGLDLVARRRMASEMPDVLKLAGGADAGVRRSAMLKIGEVGGETEIPAMLDLLMGAQSREDMEAAEQSLSALSTRAAKPDTQVSQLSARLAGANDPQKLALLRVIGAAGGNAGLAAMRQATRDASREVRLTAVRTLGSWSGNEAAPDLLEYARNATDPGERMVALRAYLNIAAQGELQPSQRVEMCRNVAALAGKDDEKKLLLGTLSNIQSPEAVQAISPYLKDADVKEEAATAVVFVSARLLEKKVPAALGAQLAEALSAAAGATAREDLANRAKALAEKARGPAAQ